MGYERPFRITFPIVLIGYFFNLTLVSAVGGDAIRMWEIHRTGLPPAAAFNSVTIDRLMQYLAHILIVVVVLPASFRLVSDPLLRHGVLLLIAATMLGFCVGMLLDRVPLPSGLRRVAKVLGQFSVDLRRVLLAPKPAAVAILLGLCNQAGVTLVVIILAAGLGLPITWLQCAVVVPLSMLATALPVSIGGWGVREGAFVTGFGLLGIAAPDALALSVLFGLLNMAVRLPGGILWLTMSRDRTPARSPVDHKVERPLVP
jgi:uncharacterized membrane protein YbhN (UPF0104 family)